MAELTLSQEHCLLLRAQAHRLDPVVLLGAGGLSEAALREIDRALTAHGLVKVRGGKIERAERDALFSTMAGRLGAARVQVIGHTFVLFRPQPLAPAKAVKSVKPARTGGAKQAPPRAAERTGRPATARAGAGATTKARPLTGRARAAARQR
jgi:putative YhbY family RNA-binding protein